MARTSIDLPQTEEDILKRVEYLINTKRNFPAAYRLLVRFMDQHRDNLSGLSAAFWFQLMLLSGFVSESEMLPHKISEMFPIYLERMRLARGYTAEMYGDVLRDRALALIRGGKLSEADKVLSELVVSKVHENDLSRMAVFHMTVGRLHYARGQYQASELMLETAYQQMLWATQPNQQWKNNIAFQWIRAAARVNHRLASTVYDEFMRHEKSTKRRLAANIMYRLGRRGVWLVERFGV